MRAIDICCLLAADAAIAAQSREERCFTFRRFATCCAYRYFSRHIFHCGDVTTLPSLLFAMLRRARALLACRRRDAAARCYVC